MSNFVWIVCFTPFSVPLINPNSLKFKKLTTEKLSESSCMEDIQNVTEKLTLHNLTMFINKRI